MTKRLKRLRKQLKRKLGLKSERPSFTGIHYDQAKRMLLDVVEIFNQADLPYTIDAGTLLGLVRDGDLIPWDNDIDLLLPVASVPALAQLYPSIRRCGWRVSRTYKMEFETKAWEIGQPRVIKIRSRNKFLIGPGSTLLDITIIYPDENDYTWEMAKKVCKIERSFFDQHDYIEFSGKKLRVPNEYQKYLQRIYGDWQTPQKNYSHSECGVIQSG